MIPHQRNLQRSAEGTPRAFPRECILVEPMPAAQHMAQAEASRVLKAAVQRRDLSICHGCLVESKNKCLESQILLQRGAHISYFYKQAWIYALFHTSLHSHAKMCLKSPQFLK